MLLETLVVGPLEVNCYLIAKAPNHEALVIDPGSDAEVILGKIREHNLTLRYILNTHGHFDHTGANRLLKEETGAEILISERDASLLPVAQEHARSFGLYAEASPPPDRLVAHGDRIDVGSLSLEVLATPGHTEGGVCFFLDRVLFTGDTLFAGSIGRTDLPGGSFRKIMISIQEVILPLGNAVAIYPGHGPASTLERERRTNPFLVELAL